MSNRTGKQINHEWSNLMSCQDRRKFAEEGWKKGMRGRDVFVLRQFADARMNSEVLPVISTARIKISDKVLKNSF